MKDIRKLMFLYAADKDVGETEMEETGTAEREDTGTERGNTETRTTGHESNHDTGRNEPKTSTETSEETVQHEESESSNDSGSSDNIENFEESFTPTETDDKKKTARKTVEDVFKEAKDLGTLNWLANERQKSALGMQASMPELSKKIHNITMDRAEAARAEAAGEITRDEAYQKKAELDEKMKAAMDAANSWRNMVHEIGQMVPEEISRTVEERRTLQDNLGKQLLDIQEQRKKDKNNEELKQKEAEAKEALNKAAIDTANSIEEIQNKLGINPSRQTPTFKELVEYYQTPGRQTDFWTAVGAFMKSAAETIKQGINPLDEQSKLAEVTKDAAVLRSKAETILRINRAETAGDLNLESELRTKVPFNTEDGLNVAFLTAENPTIGERLKAGIRANFNRNWYRKLDREKVASTNEIRQPENEYHEVLKDTSNFTTGREYEEYFGKMAGLDQKLTEAYDKMVEYAKTSGEKDRRNANLFVGLSELGAGLATTLVEPVTGVSLITKGLVTLGDEATANSLKRAVIEFDWQMKNTLSALGKSDMPETPVAEGELTEEKIGDTADAVDLETVRNLRRRSQNAQNMANNRGLSDDEVYSFIKQNYANDAPLRNVKV